MTDNPVPPVLPTAAPLPASLPEQLSALRVENHSLRSALAAAQQERDEALADHQRTKELLAETDPWPIGSNAALTAEVTRLKELAYTRDVEIGRLTALLDSLGKQLGVGPYPRRDDSELAK